MDCLFCKISAGELPAQIIYQDDEILAFYDIHPQAPTHILIIPKKHIATLNEMSKDDIPLAGHLLYTAKQLAKQQGIDEQGFRVVFNCNKGAGQAVFHIHLHLLGGRPMHWPPG